jgi:hypothetical protein
MKRLALLSVAAATLIVLVAFLTVGFDDPSSTCLACGGGSGVVDKAPCETFTVNITFENTGKTEGTWSVNIAFEGESWTWRGTPQIVTLKPSETKTLTWNGSVPCNASIGSMARLIVYYNNSLTPLNWWIHVVPSAELTITSSTVR